MSYTKHQLTAGAGPGPGYANYGQAGGILVGFGLHVPSLTLDTKTNPFPAIRTKCPVIVYGHGIDHRVTVRGDITTANGVDRVALKGVPAIIAPTGADITVMRPGGLWNNPADRYKFIVAFPQCSQEYGTFPLMYAIEMIKYVKANLWHIADLENIWYVGYSFGGGLANALADDPYAMDNLAGIIAIAPGYNASPGYAVTAANGMPMIHFSTVPDALANPASATVGTDNFVNGLNAQSPAIPHQYYRFSGNTPGTQNHDDILITVCDPGPYGAEYELSNGSMFVHDRSIYEMMLQHTLARRKK